MKTKLSTHIVEFETYTPRIAALVLLAALLLLILTGCQREPSSNINSSISGVYSLVALDDKAVPCEISHEGMTMAIKSGTFTITDDGHCSSRMIFSVAAGKEMDLVRTASYTREGSELTMKWEGQGMTLGNFLGNTFFMTNEGMVLKYRK